MVKPVKITQACACIHGRGRSERRMTRLCNMAVCTNAPNFENHETSSKAQYYLGTSTPLEKVLQDCQVLLDHHDNLFTGHYGCGTQPLPPPEYPPPILSFPWPIILHDSNSRRSFIIQEVSLFSLSYDYISIFFNTSIFVH
ncbi:hypothetical protein GOBAR_AA00326 [Gossypium barbadense]|uniref:Uncharacterized protein n=1 Tax=Gossypium barbadense TaxID=3634 RepID=A0A2P5YXK2_GOSBA|nr:hypothetical protein GOBAR_AA00326 [Gossypium barbadense]